MCGRYSLIATPEVMRGLFLFDNRPNLAARYNIAPTQHAPVVRIGAAGRELALLSWGLVPPWAKDTAMGAKMINARAETVAEKPAFRAAYRKRRCLVPADGFYEWRTENGAKQPFRIGMKGGALFAFAGLWEHWTDPADAARTVETFTILTTAANAKLRPIHPRMPVILSADRFAAWLDADAGPADVPLGPHPVEPMAFYRVGTRVNNVRNDDPACIEPLNPPSARRVP